MHMLIREKNKWLICLKYEWLYLEEYISEKEYVFGSILVKMGDWEAT
jgi:hypothetical protein